MSADGSQWSPNGARPHVRRLPAGSRSLFLRVFLTNAAVLLIAAALLLLSPATVSSPPALDEITVLALGLGAMLIVNLFLMRRTFAPLNRVRDLMRRFDPLRPGQRLPVDSLDPEIFELTTTFNAMVERLEAERRESSGRALAAQERERRRLARELHDEIGQSLTGLLLLLESASRTASGDVRERIAEARQAARASLVDLRRIVERLRPEALDDLGLHSALVSLTDRVAEQSGLTVTRRLDPGLPPLDPDCELVIYRIAQESLTNVIRHAEATSAELRLERSPDGVRLSVTDDGIGLGDGPTEDASGIRGMRERALLVSASLTLDESPHGGAQVTLEVPLSQVRA
jgi:two-component system sensor histidine kinase UhpB